MQFDYSYITKDCIWLHCIHDHHEKHVWYTEFGQLCGGPGRRKKKKQDWDKMKGSSSSSPSKISMAISPSLRLQKGATRERLCQLQLVQAKNKVLSFANPLRFPNKTPRGQTLHFMTHLYSRPPITYLSFECFSQYKGSYRLKYILE